MCFLVYLNDTNHSMMIKNPRFCEKIIRIRNLLNLQQSLYSQSNCKIAMNHEWISGRLCETITWSQATSIFYLLDSSCLATCLKYLEALTNSISMPGNTRNALASALFAVLPKWQPIIKPWTDAGGKLSIYPKVPTFMLDVVSESCLLLNMSADRYFARKTSLSIS